jgi:transcriptional regulator with XRE-family HTH domain
VARPELARFLRDRRERLAPAEVGLPAGGLRRTPGLRREEVAALAHMSVDYYVRLEQARGPHPSARVLDGLSDALRLDAAERGHLFRLVGLPPTPPPGPNRRVRPHVAALLHRMPDTAAIVTDASYEVIAWNPLAAVLLGGLPGNLARRRFLTGPMFASDRTAEFGAIAVARLRAATVRYPRDERLAALVAELRAGSADFARLWAADPVHAIPGHRRKTVDHPSLGRLTLNCDVLAVPEDDQQVVFITADPGSRAERALRELGGRLVTCGRSM